MTKKNWLIATALAVLVTATLLIGCAPANNVSAGTTLSEVSQVTISNQQQGISVNGLGEVSAVPDIATLRLGIEVQKESVSEAQSQAAEAMDKVTAALTQSGIAKKDIQTQQFSIYPVTKWDRESEEQTVVGYRVTNIVTVTVRNIDKIGTIIDSVAEAGGDYTRIDNISFSIDDPAPYYKEARQLAMTDAKDKAQQLAKLAGVTLGRATYISEYSQYPRSVYQPSVAYAMDERSLAVETPISAGEMDITLTIQVIFAIGN